MAVQPFDIARLYQTIESASRNIGNLESQRKLKTQKFVGEETEIAQDTMRDIESSIQKILGKAGGGGGAASALGTAAMFMNPLAGSIVSGLTSFLGGSQQKKRAKRAIKKAGLELKKLPSKYEKSWMGKTVKDFTSGYENQFEQMKQNLPSGADIFKSALISGVGSYLMSGGKGEMDSLRGQTAADSMGYSIDPTYGDMSLNVNPGVGLFTGGMDLKGGGRGTSLFGGKDSLLQQFFSGDASVYDAMSNAEKMQLGQILQLLKLDRE
jgi:uncharacterized protein YukE